MFRLENILNCIQTYNWHVDILCFPNLKCEALTYEETQTVTKGRLGPYQAGFVGLLSRTVDETSSNPGCSHGQHANKQSDVATRQHNLVMKQLSVLYLCGL